MSIHGPSILQNRSIHSTSTYLYSRKFIYLSIHPSTHIVHTSNLSIKPFIALSIQQPIHALTQGQPWCIALGAERIKGLAQGPTIDSLAVLGHETLTFWSVTQNHWATTASITPFIHLTSYPSNHAFSTYSSTSYATKTYLILFIHPFMQILIQPLILLSKQPFLHPSLIYSLIHSFIHSATQLSSQTFNFPLTINSYIYPTIHSYL